MANKFREIPKVEEPIDEQVESTTEPAPRVTSTRRKGVLAKGLSSVFSGTFLTSEKTVKHLPYILFLALLAILYIANGYYADDKIRQVNKINNQLKELRSEYISTTSDLMFESKQSQVAKAVEEIGLKEPVVPPKKIVVDSTILYSNSGKSGE